MIFRGIGVSRHREFALVRSLHPRSLCFVMGGRSATFMRETTIVSGHTDGVKRALCSGRSEVAGVPHAQRQAVPG